MSEISTPPQNEGRITQISQYLNEAGNAATKFVKGLAEAHKINAAKKNEQVLIDHCIQASKAYAGDRNDPNAVVVKGLVDSASQNVRSRLEELGLNDTYLVNSPTETIAQILEIDQKEAENFLAAIGIDVKKIKYQTPETFGVLALAAETLAANLDSLRQKEEDEAEKVQGFVPRSKSPIPGRAATAAAKSYGGIKKTGRIVRNIAIGCLVATCSCLGAIIGITAFDIGGIGTAARKGSVKPTSDIQPNPTVRPYDERENERANATLEYYQRNPETYNPLTLTPVIKEQLIPLRWDWWNLRDPEQLARAFQGKLDKTDLNELVKNPEYFFNILKVQHDQAYNSKDFKKADEYKKLIDLYLKRKNFTGTPQEFIKQYINNPQPHLSPKDIERQMVVKRIAAFQRETSMMRRRIASNRNGKYS